MTTGNKTGLRKGCIMIDAERLKELRKKKGYTQAEVAEKAEITQTYYSQIESGIKTPKVAVLAKIAEALGISLSSLVDEEGQNIVPIDLRTMTISEAIRTLEAIAQQPLKPRDRRLLLEALEWAKESLSEQSD